MRRPAVIERAGTLTPRDRMWAAMRSLQGTPTCSWSPLEVQFLANARAGEPVHVDSVITYLKGLARAKPPYVELVISHFPVGRKRVELHLYRLVRDVGAHAPRVTEEGGEVTQGTGRQQMWNVARQMRGDFSWRDLAHRASTRAHPIAPAEARRYLLHLAQAGYVRSFAARRALGRGNGALPGRVEFVRSRDSGPRAPLVTKLRQVMDANTGQIVYDPRLQPAGAGPQVKAGR